MMKYIITDLHFALSMYEHCTQWASQTLLTLLYMNEKKHNALGKNNSYEDVHFLNYLHNN